MNRAYAASPSRTDSSRCIALGWLGASLLALGAVDALSAQSRNSRSRDNDRSVRLDTTVAVERGTILDVSSGNGVIVVRGWDRGEMEIRAQSEGGEFLFNKSARSVRLEARRSARPRDNEVNIEVRVPLNTRVVVSNSAGDVQVLDVRGEVDANLLRGDLIIRGASGRTAVVGVSGDIRVSDVDGPIKVQSMTGDITLSEIRGDVDVSSSSSEVSLSGIQANIVRAEVVQGEISFDGTFSSSGRYEFGTHSGDIHLYFADNAAGTLNLQSFKGELHSGVPLSMQPDSASGRPLPAVIRQLSAARTIPLSQGRRLLFGGGGSAVVTVTTFNGDVHISRGPRRVEKEK